MFKKILIALVVLIGGFAAFVTTRPDTFRVERSATVAAPAEVVFPLMNDFHQWQRWSPWAKLDPQQKATYDGAASGVGAKYQWTGNDKVGEGRMTITESRAHEQVAIKLEFLKPWESTNTATFTLAPAGNEVKVTWAMEGHNNFVGKAFSVFMDMDAMIGKDFEQGLAAMKAEAEADAKVAAAPSPEAEVAEPAAP